MFNLNDRPSLCCDGTTRREVVKAGFLGLGGLTLSELLRLRGMAAETGQPTRKTSVIFVELAGGPSHIETYDPKPEAPPEYRGPFSAISTNVPGVAFSETQRHQAQVADKMSVIRSLHHDSRSHSSSQHLIQTGYYLGARNSNSNEMPSVGSVAAKVRGANRDGLPAYVGVPRSSQYGDAAYLGNGHNPFEVGGNPASDNFRVRNLTPVGNLDADRLTDRTSLLGELDTMRRVAEQNRNAEAMDAFGEQAVELVTGKAAQKAFDIEQEPDKLRRRYGMNRIGQSMLLARRLVESGVTFATVRDGGWDDHQRLVDSFKGRHANLDRAVATLVSDLHERGLQKDVMVVVMGEFGRTPKMNNRGSKPGRDHWGRIMSAALAGGDLPGGAVVGASNRKGEEPIESPYRPENVLAMVYRHLGIDTKTKFLDNSGRPRYILENRQLISELT